MPNGSMTECVSVVLLPLPGELERVGCACNSLIVGSYVVRLSKALRAMPRKLRVGAGLRNVVLPKTFAFRSPSRAVSRGISKCASATVLCLSSGKQHAI